jgi:hypothetical protein
MGDAEKIKEHEEGLFQLLPRASRARARYEFDRDGDFPIVSFEEYQDERWTEVVRSGRQTAADLSRELQSRGAGRNCVLFDDHGFGFRKELVPLGGALRLVDQGETWFLISCLPGRLAYYHGEHRFVRFILDRTKFT